MKRDRLKTIISVISLILVLLSSGFTGCKTWKDCKKEDIPVEDK
jgi:hypothetical protein